ncbi:VOC family protein [Amaricoccus macauensis]|uniref:VOC family protein n=1 Tax=Amaricoccus macauensis TaxID=57001 RepID=UPI003C7E2AF3
MTQSRLMQRDPLPTRRELMVGGAATLGALGAAGPARAQMHGPMHGPSQPIFTLQQVCYVVDDLDAALKYWTEELKVGPFFLFEHAPLENQIFRGEPTEADVTLALGNSGAVQVELVVQHNDAPSVYKEWMDGGRRGLHHFGYMPQDYAANREHFIGLGHAPAFECTIGDSPLVYFDMLDTLGHYVEFWEDSAVYREIFRRTEEAARSWDGSDPVRPWT